AAPRLSLRPPPVAPSRVTSPVSGSNPNPLNRTERSLGTIACRGSADITTCSPIQILYRFCLLKRREAVPIVARGGPPCALHGSPRFLLSQPGHSSSPVLCQCARSRTESGRTTRRPRPCSATRSTAHPPCAVW